MRSREARALVLMTPGGFEHMFLDGGATVVDPSQAPARDYDVEQVVELSRRYGMEVVGPPLE